MKIEKGFLSVPHALATLRAMIDFDPHKDRDKPSQILIEVWIDCLRKGFIFPEGIVKELLLNQYIQTPALEKALRESGETL